VTDSSDSSVLNTTDRKQSFTTGRLYSERFVFTMTTRIKLVITGMICRDRIKFLVFGGAKVLRMKTIWLTLANPRTGPRTILDVAAGYASIRRTKLSKHLQSGVDHLPA